MQPIDLDGLKNTIERVCNRTVFAVWLATCYIPQLRSGQWVVLDNATFHHGGRVAELTEAAGYWALTRRSGRLCR